MLGDTEDRMTTPTELRSFRPQHSHFTPNTKSFRPQHRSPFVPEGLEMLNSNKHLDDL